MGEVMPLTPEDVSNKRFTPVRLREGYDMGEVDQFLDEVEAELARLTKENDDLRSKLSAAQSGAPVAAPAPTPEPT
jgi:DivIVA domain-containing protein